ncbi:hypothetical protein GCM10009608_24400 [Pseudonocardia alaniniphila]
MRALPHAAHDRADVTSALTRFDRVLDAVAQKLPEVAAHLDAACPCHTSEEAGQREAGQRADQSDANLGGGPGPVAAPTRRPAE